MLAAQKEMLQIKQTLQADAKSSASKFKDQVKAYKGEPAKKKQAEAHLKEAAKESDSLRLEVRGFLLAFV